MAKERLLTRVFVLAFVANFVHSLAFHTYLHLPGFVQDLGADEFLIGVVMGTLSAASIAARPTVGRIMDTKGRRTIALVGGVLHMVAALAYLAIDSLGPLLFAVRVLHGVAQAMLFSVLFTIAADIIPASRRAEGMALFGISGMLPLSLGGLLGDWVLAVASYHELFYVTAAAAGLGLLASLMVAETRPDGVGQIPPRGFMAAVRQPSLRPVWFVALVFSLALASYFTFIKTYVRETEIGTVGLFFTTYSIAAIVLRLFLGWVPDRFGLRRTLVPSMWILAMGIVLLAGYRDTWTLGLAGVLCGIGHGYTFPIITALTVERARATERGSALAIFTALFDVGVLVGGPTLGAVIQVSSYTVMFASAASIAVLGSVAFLLWDRAAGH